MTLSKEAVSLRVEQEKWNLVKPVRITGYTFVSLDLLVVTLRRGECTGRGEAVGVYYREDDLPSMQRQVDSVRADIESGMTREALQRALPPGGARNALDCALWDLEAQSSGRAVWQLCGLERPKPILTTFTLGADEPPEMAEAAHAYPQARAIKLKMLGDGADADRVRAVREARPDVWLSIDANQGFTRGQLEEIMPVLVSAGVQVIEQPVRLGHEAQLEGFDSPIKIAADESVQHLRDLPGLLGRFNMINIKLDKCGGLTEALLMAHEARRLGLDVMVGNMGGTSLAMAPGFLVGQLCSIVDLDGPLIFSADREYHVTYEGGQLWCPESVWGGYSSARRGG
jgi:L-alanine-DL-glutamate epimerase-like enolase superfamily enzyme